jgi:hypothetical protein
LSYGSEEIPVRAVRHGLLTTGLVLVVCAVIAALSAVSYVDAASQLRGLTARGQGEIVGVVDQVVEVRWDSRTVRVPLAVAAPPVGTRTEIAYDPAAPERAIVPGAQVLADADRATSGLVFSALVALGVLVIGAWRLATRARLRRRPVVDLSVRRVRVQRGLIVRSWLETADRWIPVYFDPVLAAMPSPTTVRAHGDVRRDRLVAVEFDGVLLYPSGKVVRAEPKGRRTDSPARPDEREPVVSTPLRQLRVDAAGVVAAPFVGLFWAFVDGSGPAGWFGATALVAALALWSAALRGSDPS